MALRMGILAFALAQSNLIRLVCVAHLPVHLIRSVCPKDRPFAAFSEPCGIQATDHSAPKRQTDQFDESSIQTCI